MHGGEKKRCKQKRCKYASTQAGKTCRGLGFGNIDSPLGGGNGLRNETKKKRGSADPVMAGIMEFFSFLSSLLGQGSVEDDVWCSRR